MIEQEREGLGSESASVEVQPTQDRTEGVRRTFYDFLETLLLAAVLFFGINAVSARIRVDGFSMEPTLRTGAFVFVNRLAYRLGDPHLGDVIVFHYPRDPKQEYIKRVIGLPGDEVVVRDGEVRVNGMLLDEPYIMAEPRYESALRVPEDSLFVLGDNRNDSSDSHTWGEVPLENVVGKALFVYWPPEEWTWLEHRDTKVISP